MTKLTKLKTLK